MTEYATQIMIKQQLSQNFTGVKVLLRAGKQSLEKCSAGIAVCNGLLTDWITIYPNGTFARDGLFELNKPIRVCLEAYAKAQAARAKLA